MPSESTVSEIFKIVFGDRPDSVKCWLTDNHSVYQLAHCGQKYYLKFALADNAADLQFEHQANRFLECCGLPCPFVVGSSYRQGRVNDEYEWLMIEHSGESMGMFVQKHPELLFQAGKLLAKYHRACDSIGERKLGLMPPPVFNLETRVERWLIQAKRLCDAGHLPSQTCRFSVFWIERHLSWRIFDSARDDSSGSSHDSD